MFTDAHMVPRFRKLPRAGIFVSLEHGKFPSFTERKKEKKGKQCNCLDKECPPVREVKIIHSFNFRKKDTIPLNSYFKS